MVIAANKPQSVVWAKEAQKSGKVGYALFAGQSAFNEGLSVDACPFTDNESDLRTTWMNMFQTCANSEYQRFGRVKAGKVGLV